MLSLRSWIGLLVGAAALCAILALRPAVTPVESQPPLSDDTTDVFMWTGASNFLPEDSLLFRTKLAFAERQGIIPYESGIHDPEELRRFLQACREVGIERSWIEIGPDNGITAKAFATDSSARAATLERFRALAEAYKAHDPESVHITIFDEAPLGAFDPAPGTGYEQRVAAFREYGPTAFAQMYRALKKGMPSAEVGIFLHHPHNASPEMAGPHTFIDSFMAAAEQKGATPDFIYSDVYRGYFNRGYGVEATNDYITDVVAHTKEVARRYDAEAHHLGQTHTIKLGYTPSRWEIDTNVRAMLRGEPDGVGWYWPNYASTNHTKGPDGTPAQPEGYDVSFDPFIPNSWGKTGPAGSLFATSRDRFVYSYLRIQEATGRLTPENRFDLWLYGYDFDHAEHKVYVRSSDAAEWTFLGTVNPQRDRDAYVEESEAEHVYSYNDKWHAVVFHGLKRAAHLSSDEAGARVEVKVTTRDGSDASRLGAAYALPYRATRHYATEEKATRLIERHPRWMAVNSLAHHVRPVPDTLRAGDTRTYTLMTDAPLDSARVREWKRQSSP
jgi:hypothetical protein